MQMGDQTLSDDEQRTRFDAVFDEIERFRRHPMMMQVRDVEL